jgi:5'-phosphate synthase pdxT subunit
MAPTTQRLGILALQGAFEEHTHSFKQIPEELLKRLEIVQVRTSKELEECDALVIPGGESTTMKIIAGMDTLMEDLRVYVHGGNGRKPRPVWGTCAGCILLSDTVINGYAGGGGANDKVGIESLAKRCKYGDPVGGLDISTCRNYFGRQSASFEAPTFPDPLMKEKGCDEAFGGFPAVFIRAPAILKVGNGVKALARVRHPGWKPEDGNDDSAIVAAASSTVMVTCFHPELAPDSRIHQYFVENFVLRSPA